jgi:small subunit ribosomal protein S6
VITAEQDARAYELVYILRPDMDDEGVKAFNERIGQVVTNHTGAMTTTEVWGRRALAYPINKLFEGIYILQRFEMAPDGTSEIDRILRFDENVMRYLLIRTDE